MLLLINAVEVMERAKQIAVNQLVRKLCWNWLESRDNMSVKSRKSFL